MTPHETDFAWDNYAPQHRAVIALRREQAKRLYVCTLCHRAPIELRMALVHVWLRSVGAETLDARKLVKSLALCPKHAQLDCDELADYCWPGWRDMQASTSDDTSTRQHA